jgi:hypothetical protein
MLEMDLSLADKRKLIEFCRSWNHQPTIIINLYY